MGSLQSSNLDVATTNQYKLNKFIPFFTAVGGRVATANMQLIKEGKFTELFAREFDHTKYVGLDDYNKFHKDWISYNLLRKSSFVDLGKDLDQAAVDSFHESEAECASINDRGLLLGDKFWSSEDLKTLELAKSLIAKTLGPLVIDDWFNECAHGTGAGLTSTRALGHPVYKLQGSLACTPDAAPIISLYDSLDKTGQAIKKFVGDKLCLTLVKGSRFTTVPKNTKTKRGIALEPEGNMFLQKGLGRLIRQALRRSHIDLNDQTKNQRLARLGSCLGNLATIDLSAASDSIACGLVRFLLPEQWADALFSVRSPNIFIDGEWIELEKISSMGNGYTFELESLIFWALTKATTYTHGKVEVVNFNSSAVISSIKKEIVTILPDRRVSIYGDDIICHKDFYEPLRRLFSRCGFKINDDKSFHTGPFRESCGAHYYLGNDVTPIYVQDEEIHVTTWCHLINSIRLKELNSIFRDTTYYFRTVNELRKQHVPSVPAQLGLKSGIIVNLDEAMGLQKMSPKYTIKSGGFRTKHFRNVPVKRLLAGKKVQPTYYPACHNAYRVWLSNAGKSIDIRYSRSPVDENGRVSVDLSLETNYETRFTVVYDWPVVPCWF